MNTPTLDEARAAADAALVASDAAWDAYKAADKAAAYIDASWPAHIAAAHAADQAVADAFAVYITTRRAANAAAFAAYDADDDAGRNET